MKTKHGGMYMSKFNDQEIKKLLEEVISAKQKGESLSNVFEKTAQKTGKAKGSVRNTYYAVLKRAESDSQYKAKIMGEYNLKAEKPKEFDEKESDMLLRKILTGVTFGKSVRRSVYEMSQTPKQALRYQNKYRNLLKYDMQRVERIRNEIKNEFGKCYNPTAEKIKKDENLSKLKKEINSLCDRISKELRVENSNLKLQLKKYEEENAKLRILASRTHSSVEDYFKNDILVKQEKIND